MESAPSVTALGEDPKAIFVTLLARELHRAGSACDQIEDTVTAIAGILGVQVEIFALPTNITLAVGPRYAQQIVMLRLNPAGVSLRRLALLNEVIAELQGSRIGLEAANARLREIDAQCGPPPAVVSIFSLACVAIGVAVLLGGGESELVVAALIGASTGILSFFSARIPVMDRLFEVIAAFAGTLIVAAYAHFVTPVNLYISIVAGVVVLLPGYSLTLALHELANQDLIAGTARLGRVLAKLLALGCGAFLGFEAVGKTVLSTGNVLPHPVGAAYWVGAVVLLSIGLSIELDARARDFLWVFIASIVALASVRGFAALPAYQVAPFMAALVCGLVANIGARILRFPQPVFLVPALHVLVPGALSYQSVLWAFSRHYGDAAQLATNAVTAAILIVAGLLLSQLLVPALTLNVRATDRR